MTLDELLSEISYQLPKGYPTIVDGKFVDRDEVLLINKFLLKEGIGQLPLPEAKPVFEASKTVDAAVVDSTHNKIMSLPIVKQQIGATASSITKVKSTPKFTEWRVDMPGKDERVLQTTTIAKDLKQQKLTSALNKQSQLIVRNGKALVFVVDGYEYRYLLKPVKKESSTSTNVKEGMSVILSQYNEQSVDPTKVISFVTTETIKQSASELLNYTKKKKVTGLSDKTIEECNAFLQLVIDAKNPSTVKDAAQIINQNISHSSTFNDFLINNKDYTIERDELFNKIRSIGSAITGYPADKWCPGDIYFVKKDAISTINKTISQANAMFAPAPAATP